MENDGKYLPELMAEKDSIDPSFEHAVRLITQEIDNVKNPKPEAKQRPKKVLLDVSGKPQRVECDILVPADRFPSVNFVGRLIGPGGSTMKGLQELTNTKMAVLGKGSVRENERKKAFVNLGRAAAEIQKLLVVDEATEAQYGVAAAMNHPAMRGRGRGGRGGGRGQNQRGGGSFQRGGRGAGSRGATAGRGRGGRGRGRGQTQQFSQMQQSGASENFTEDYSYDSYGGASFGQGYEGYGDSFDNSYDGSFGADAYGDASYTEEYGNYGQESYDAYGNGAGTQNSGTFGTQSFRGKMRGGGRGARQKPY